LLGYHIRRLSVLVMADLSDALAPHQLSPADASILLSIGARPGVTQSAVGRSLGILRANMAPLVGALATRGLIARTRVDGRSQALSLSHAGEALCQTIKTIIKDHEDRMFGSLTKADRQKLAAALGRLWRSRS
jgi:DNA-binding MarR family transcriptional regulator